MSSARIAQLSLTPLVYVLVAIAIILVAAAGIYQYQKTAQSIDDTAILLLEQSLAKAFETDSSQFGNVETMSFAIPKSIKQVCLLDTSFPVDEFANIDLSAAKDIYTDSNLFLKKDSGFEGRKISHLRLDGQDNPLCINVYDAKISLQLANKGSHKGIMSTGAKAQNDCTAVSYSGDYHKNLDIVFLASNFEDIDGFRSEISSHLDVLLSVEPFFSRKDKMNFFIVEDLESLNCESDKFIRCNELEMHELASQCPNDVIVVLHKDAISLPNIIMPPRSSSVRNTIKLTSLDSKTVLLHELGHVIGQLADEYSDDEYYARIVNFNPSDYPNCDTQGCMKWQADPGCHEGCSLSSGFFRPTDSSIMRELSSTDYGQVGEKEMELHIDNYG